MATRAINRRSTLLGVNGQVNYAPIYVDSDDNILKMIPAGTGTTEVQIVDASSVQTLTNKTLTSPTITGSTLTTATLTQPTITDPLQSDLIKQCTTQFDAVIGTTGTTLTNVVGLTGFSLLAAGIYAYEIHISGTSTLNSGLKLGLGFTTLTATSHDATGKGYTASAVAVQHTTTATTGMSLFAQTAAVIAVDVFGLLVVNAAGTVAVQAAQNAAHIDTTSVYVGSWAKFRRIG